MKKRVYIITIHKEPNYGAVLQAFALYKVIERLGAESYLINLSMDYRKLPYTMMNRVLITLKNWIKGYQYCFRKASDFIFRQCPRLIGDFHTVEELNNYPWPMDAIYLVGSDQVWNPGITGSLAPAYTLSFLSERYPNKYAYASSFGNIKNEAQRAAQLDLGALKRFKQISTREEFGVGFLAKHDIHAITSIDPTLLIEDYTFLLQRPVIPENCILFLSLSDTSDINRFVQDVSVQYKLPVKKFYGYLQPQRKKNLKFIDVEEWLKQIASASLVITDSFHATVFSILFNRPFYVYISEPTKIYRISDLLNRLNLQNRIVKSTSEINLTEEINYEEVKARLFDYRKQSLEYLSSIISAK